MEVEPWKFSYDSFYFVSKIGSLAVVSCSQGV